MAERFVVEVIEKPQRDIKASVEKLASAFNVDRRKVEALVQRLPDKVTRPISERDARVIARQFNEAGLRAIVRPVETSAPTEEDFLPEKGVASTPIERVRSSAVSGESPDDVPGKTPIRSRAGPPVTAPTGRRATAPADDGNAGPDPGSLVGRRPDPRAGRVRQRGAGVEAAAAGAVPGPQEALRSGVRERTRRRRGSIRTKLLITAVVPTLLAVVGALAATWFSARPALYQQLIDSARNPAIATAASLSSLLAESDEGDDIDFLKLQETILITRQAFQRQDISFIVATDADGNPLSGWFASEDSFTADTVALQTIVRTVATDAVARGPEAREGRSEEAPGEVLMGADGSRIEVVSQPLLRGEQAFGAIVVGISDAAVTRQVRGILQNVLLFSLIPLGLALLIAILRARQLTGNVLRLTRTADRLSRGDLEASLDVRSNDELDDLSEALERMRASMQEALERLRRRRG